MTGREISLNGDVTRVVALTAADCEILYAVGAGDAVVGRGEYCDYPEAALSLPEGWIVASTGEATAAAPDENGLVAWTARAENARDFSLAFSRKMNERRGETAGGLAVRAWANTGSGAQAMLDAALPALEAYEAWFGGLGMPSISRRHVSILSMSSM